MSPLLAPLFAQLVTLGVSDRTEARYLDAYEDKYYEAQTNPNAALNIDYQRYNLALGYGASLLLTPLESKPRDLLVYHNAWLSTSYRLRRTSFSISSGVSFGEVNFQVLALQQQRGSVPPATDQNEPPVDGETPAGEPEPEPAPNAQPQPGAQPGAQPGTGQNGAATPPQQSVSNRAVRYGTWITSLQVNHDLRRDTSLGAFASYTMAGGLNDAAQRDYPVTRGTVVGAQATYTLAWSARDGFVTSGTAQQAFSSNGNRATSLLANETWLHSFSKHTAGSLGAGLSITRFTQPNGLIAYSVFPNFTTSLGHQMQLARGTFSILGNAYSAPALDPLRATVDPRVGVGGNMGWSRERFSTWLGGTAAVSIAAPDADAGAFDDFQGWFGVSYRVAEYVGIDAGGRVAQQQFQDVTTVPLSYAAYVGLDLGYAVPLFGSR